MQFLNLKVLSLLAKAELFMTRSKIFLALTASLLAASAFVSARAKFLTMPVAYKKSGVCTASKYGFPAQTILNGVQLVTAIGASHYGLYTNINGQLSCSDPVFLEE